MTAERIALGTAILAAITVFLLALSIGRPLAARRALLARMGRFLGAAPAMPANTEAAAGQAPLALGRARAGDALAAHRTHLLFLLGGVMLLIVGKILYGWVLGVTLGLVVVVFGLW